MPLTGQDRLDFLGITEQNSSVTGVQTQGYGGTGKAESYPLFRAKQNGDIEITFCDLNGDVLWYDAKKGDKAFVKTRLANPKKGRKYIQPRAAPQPWFPPHIVRMYKRAQAGDEGGLMHTLVLVEGEFKAMRGALAGLNIVAIPGIHNIKQKVQARGELFEPLRDLILACQVREVVILFDADCKSFPENWDPKSNDFTERMKDLGKRPRSFYTAVRNLREGIGNLPGDIKTHFVHSHRIWARQDPKNKQGQHPLLKQQDNPTGKLALLEEELKTPPKGLDDLLLHYPEQEQDIVAEILDPERKGRDWTQSTDITAGGAVSNYALKTMFFAESAHGFYQHFAAKIGASEFVYGGHRWRWIDSDEPDKGGELRIVEHAHAKNYIYVAGKYYYLKKMETSLGRSLDEKGIKNELKKLEYQAHDEKFIRRLYPEDPFFVKNIRMYHSFVVIPNNRKKFYEREIKDQHGQYWNMWEPPQWDPKAPTRGRSHEQMFPHIEQVLRHLFDNEYQDVYEVMLDWLTLKWRKPTQKLPLVGLVSEEHNTGKSTFGELLKLMLGDNAVMVGNDAIEDKFNSDWLPKGVVIVNEAFSERDKSLQKLKTLATESSYPMEMKHGARQEIEVHLSFVFTSNKERYFLPLEKGDVRFLICKVGTLKKEIPKIFHRFVEELPYFIHFLETREMTHKEEGRLWFRTSLLDTAAKRKIIESTRPTVEQILREVVIDEFTKTRLPELDLTNAQIMELVKAGNFNPIKRNNIAKTMLDSFGVEQRNGSYREHREPEYFDTAGAGADPLIWQQNPSPKRGRYYCLVREAFISDEEWAVITGKSEQDSDPKAGPSSSEPRPATDEDELIVPSTEDLPFGQPGS